MQFFINIYQLLKISYRMTVKKKKLNQTEKLLTNIILLSFTNKNSKKQLYKF